MTDSDLDDDPPEVCDEGDVTTFRYVRHSRVAAYQLMGWIDLGALPLPHGAFSNLMEWPRDAEVKEPEFDQ